MRHQVAKLRDTLNVAALPPTDGTELNYRTRPQTPEDEVRQTGRIFLSAALLVTPLGLLVSWLLPVRWLVLPILITLILVFLARAFFVAVRERKTSRFDLMVAGVVLASAVCAWLLQAVPSRPIGYALAFPLTIAWAGIFAWHLAKQVAFWMANHPRVEWATARKWEGFLESPFRGPIPPECAELRSLRAAPYLLAAAYGVGWLALRAAMSTSAWEYAPLWGVIGFAGFSLIEFSLWNSVVSQFSWRLLLDVTWQALKVWCNYNRAGTPAAGVFRFPTPALRCASVRDGVLAATLVVVGLGLVACFPPLLPSRSLDASWKSAQLLPHEVEFLKTLPPDKVKEAETRILAERDVTRSVERWTDSIGVLCERLVLGAIVLTFGPGLLTFFVTLVVVGPLLTRYYLALEAPNGFAQSADPEWDVLVERILESKDDLEREHYLLGMSLAGDYPVLLHKSILDQHYHMTGDTGAAKTSLGIAPLATQMIARGDNSVVIIDLKGDMSLFESMRLEAERHGAVFRWFASEPGKTSHVFNPFVQSHLNLLTPEQRTESLLQAMSLDYGVGYGKSFFTAMNEVVLKNMLRRYSIRSFQQLQGYLEDPSSYRDLGPSKDFEQARHLAAIVSRLAAMYPLNVIPNVESDSPPVEVIDAMDVLHRPQVLYFFLNSPQEPIGAPSVAKLFLWALFSAAARRPSRDNRVYVFIDEFQQIISDSVKLVFEQIRDQGVTMIVAHQTGGQLKRQGTDLLETVESCTAVKQILRASDLNTIKKLQEVSGDAMYHSLAWTQTIEPGALEAELETGLSLDKADEGLVQVTESVGPRLDRNTVISVSADPQSSFVRFTSASGYTQYAGFTTPIVSMYTIPFEEYKRRKKAPWPTGEGTVLVPFPAPPSEGGERTSSQEIEDWEARLRHGLDS